MRTVNTGVSVEDGGHPAAGPEDEGLWGSRTDRRRRKVRRRILVFSGLALACALVGLVCADYSLNAGKVYRGVEAGGLALGGLTPEEAEPRLSAGAPEGEVRLVGGPEGVPGGLSARELGTELDAGETARRAYAVGREGNVLEQAAGRVVASVAEVSVRPDVEYRRAAARAGVEGLAGRVDRGPRDASVEVVGGEVRVRPAVVGYELDVPATLRAVEGAVGEMRSEATMVGRRIEPSVSTAEAERAAEGARNALSGDVVLAAGGERWVLSPGEISAALVLEPGAAGGGVRLDAERLRPRFEEIRAVMDREPTDAAVVSEEGEVRVRPAQPGRSLDEERLLAMMGGIFDGGGGGSGRSFEVPFFGVAPAVSTGEAERLRPTTLLGSFETNYYSYDDSPGRVYNLRISSEAINGAVLAPGEVFSFGEYAGDLAYEEAFVINEGRVETEAGGGLCQVASTLYMAANRAGLEIVERHAHSAQLPYIRPGFDATVWYDAYGGGKDMQFRNNTDGYLMIKQSVNEATGDVHAEVWGLPTGREVTVRSEQTPDGTWATYRRVVEDGRAVEDGVLNTSVYGTLAG